MWPVLPGLENDAVNRLSLVHAVSIQAPLHLNTVSDDLPECKNPMVEMLIDESSKASNGESGVVADKREILLLLVLKI